MVSVNYFRLSLPEVTELIQRHLTKWENDPEINKSSNGGEKFINPHVRADGRFIYVRYSISQEARRLTKLEAVTYLQQIDSGYRGRFLKPRKVVE